jgi:hypothetical protein
MVVLNYGREDFLPIGLFRFCFCQDLFGHSLPMAGIFISDLTTESFYLSI